MIAVRFTFCDHRMTGNNNIHQLNIWYNDFFISWLIYIRFPCYIPISTARTSIVIYSYCLRHGERIGLGEAIELMRGDGMWFTSDKEIYDVWLFLVNDRQQQQRMHTLGFLKFTMPMKELLTHMCIIQYNSIMKTSLFLAIIITERLFFQVKRKIMKIKWINLTRASEKNAAAWVMRWSSYYFIVHWKFVYFVFYQENASFFFYYY